MQLPSSQSLRIVLQILIYLFLATILLNVTIEIVFKEEIEESTLDIKFKKELNKHTEKMIRKVYSNDSLVVYSQVSSRVERELPQWNSFVEEVNQYELYEISSFKENTISKYLPNEEDPFVQYTVEGKLQLLVEGEMEEAMFEVEWVEEDSQLKLYSMMLPSDFTTPWWLPEPMYIRFK